MSNMQITKQHKGAVHFEYLTPAQLIDKNQCPEDWFQNNEPRTFTIKYTNGVAVVDSSIGRLMIAKGFAKEKKPEYLSKVSDKKYPDLIKCPDCSHIQPEPNQEQGLICANETCKYDFSQNLIKPDDYVLRDCKDFKTWITAATQLPEKSEEALTDGSSFSQPDIDPLNAVLQ